MHHANSAIAGATQRPAGRWRPGGPLWLLALGLFLCGALGAEPRRTAVSKEYELKAAFLYNFTKFVECPSPRFKDAAAPIVFGVIGASPYGDALLRAGVLVVGDSPEPARGAVVLFTMAGDKVRFDIDLIAAERAGLKLSSQLLKLATRVRRRP